MPKAKEVLQMRILAARASMAVIPTPRALVANEQPVTPASTLFTPELSYQEWSLVTRPSLKMVQGEDVALVKLKMEYTLQLERIQSLRDRNKIVVYEPAHFQAYKELLDEACSRLYVLRDKIIEAEK